MIDMPYAVSDVESVASGEDDLVNRLDRLKLDPQVRHRLNQVQIDAYEEAYNEKIELDSPEEIEPDEPPLNEMPVQGVAREVQGGVKARTSLRQVPSLWQGLELNVNWKLLATCGEQELLSPECLGVLEERASSREG